MNPKLLRLMLCLLTICARFIDSAIAQQDGQDAKAKFANDYNAGKWRDVIADGDLLKKNGALGAQEELIIGQAYYNATDFAGCVRYIKTIAQSDTALELLKRCNYELGY